MEFLDLVRKRYSVRGYQPREVEPEKVAQILEAVRLAPTAANYQPFRLILVHTRGREAELRRIYDKDWFVQAPLMLCACGVVQESWVRDDGKNTLDIDLAIIMTHFALAATSLGLGTCFIGAFDPVEARRILDIPAEAEPILMSPLGYPADQPDLKERRPLQELLYLERWGGLGNMSEFGAAED